MSEPSTSILSTSDNLSCSKHKVRSDRTLSHLHVLWRLVQASKLLKNIANQSPQHQQILLRLAVVGLEGLAQPPPKHKLGTEEEFAAQYPFLQSAQDRSMFLGFAGKVMLYQPAALLPRVMPSTNQNPAEACHLPRSSCLLR